MVPNLFKTLTYFYQCKSLATCLLTVPLVGMVVMPSTQASPLTKVEEPQKRASELVESQEWQIQSTPLILSQSEAPAATPEPPTIQVKTIEVTGSTIFTEADFGSIVKPLEGRTVTQAELQEATNAITQLYLEQGLITSRAILDLSTVATGEVKIQIVEGGLEEIEIKGTERLQGYVRSRLKLGTAKPLSTAKLEEQLRLLQADPLFENVEASLRAGSGAGQSILVVQVTEADPFEGNISADNYSPPSVGGERLNLSLLYRNLTGLGDEISAVYRPRFQTFGGTYQLEFRYRVPINAMNGTLEARALIDRNEVVNGPFTVLDISGDSGRYDFTYRQPIIRTPREELGLSVGFAYRGGQTFTFAGGIPFGFGPNEDGISRTSVFTFGQDYTLRDLYGAWAFRSQMRLGTGIFNATTNPAPEPDSRFFSWLGQIQRVQLINEDNFLIAQLDLQLSTDPLLASEQFVIGGGQSVRGYRQNLLAGDNGLRFSLEDRITLVRNQANEPVFVLAPFFDLGSVWNAGGNPNIIIADQQFIAALGLGLLWQPIKGLNIRLDYAPPLIYVNTRGENVQDNGFYFSAGYNF